MGNVVGFPTGRGSPGGSIRPIGASTRERLTECAEVDEMRASLLAVRSRRQAVDRIRLLAERAAAIVDEMTVDDADRVSLLWHLSAIRELACDSREPVCALPHKRSDSPRRPPDDAG